MFCIYIFLKRLEVVRNQQLYHNILIYLDDAMFLNITKCHDLIHLNSQL